MYDPIGSAANLFIRGKNKCPFASCSISTTFHDHWKATASLNDPPNDDKNLYTETTEKSKSIFQKREEKKETIVFKFFPFVILAQNISKFKCLIEFTLDTLPSLLTFKFET